MAVEVIGWVFAHSRSKNAARLVMLAVANACNNPDGTGAWMSNAALMAKTNLSERAVQNGVAEAERIGELKVERNAGRGGVNRFTVIMTPVDNPVDNIGNPAESAPFTETPQNLHPAESAPIRSDDVAQASTTKGAESAPKRQARKGAESAPGTVKNSSTKSSSDDATKTKTRGTRIPDDFHATEDMITWARKNTPNVGAAETEAFIDYWRSAPGAKGLKTDWVATWRNWMRREQKRIDEQRQRNQRASRFPANNGAGYQSPSPTLQTKIPDGEKCAKHPTYRAATCGPCRSERFGAKPAV